MPEQDVAMSNSELTTWQDCKRRWFLGYYHGFQLPPERRPLTGAMLLGTRVHKALELKYGHGADPRRALTAQYELVASERLIDTVDQVDIDKERTQALIMVDGYLEWAEETGVDDGLELVAVERDVVVSSGMSNIYFRGKLDQVVRRTVDGALLFMDWKTVGSFEMITPTLHMNPQARFYALLNYLALRRGLPGSRRVDGGLFTLLRRTKRTARAMPPFYLREEVRFNRNELEATLEKASAVANEIMQARYDLANGDERHTSVAYPNPTRDCTWKCPFVRICPLLDDGSDWYGAARANYVHGDPYEYYQDADNAKILAAIGASGTDNGVA